jgi:hypothetical protein
VTAAAHRDHEGLRAPTFERARHVVRSRAPSNQTRMLVGSGVEAGDGSPRWSRQGCPIG